MNRFSRRGVLQSAGALLAGSAIGVAACAQVRAARRTVRLSYNESPFGPSRRAREALLALGEDTWRRAYEYGYGEVSDLRSLIADHENVRPDNVFVSAGSGEILKLAALIHGEPGRQVIAARPTFPMLPQYASRRGATVAWVDVDERFGHDFPAMKAEVTDATSLVYVCNPNNPTGALANRDELRAFIEQVSPQALVLVDEAYIDFAPAPEQATMIGLARSGANVLVTRSFSKLHGLAGLRIGYGIANAAIVRRLESLRISIPNQAGVAAARASHGDTAFRAEIRSKIRASVAFCNRLFDSLSQPHAPTHANFMMFDTGEESTAVVEFARERGVLVAPVYEPLSTWARVSMGRIEDLQVFAQTLRAFVKRA
jgi:histidinol-phosphate aminotransferase